MPFVDKTFHYDAIERVAVMGPKTRAEWSARGVHDVILTGLWHHQTDVWIRQTCAGTACDALVTWFMTHGLQAHKPLYSINIVVCADKSLVEALSID
jgi:hypothetical protein